MARTSKIVRWVAFALMVVFGVVGGLFVLGETFADPGGWEAVVRSALWVVPVVALSLFALLRPNMAVAPLVAVTALVVVFSLADAAFGIVPRDDWGPVTAIALFAIGVTLAFLGLHRAGLAGLLMLVAAFGQLMAVMIGGVVSRAGDGSGPGPALGGSSGAVIVPVMAAGALFVVAAIIARESPPATHPPVSAPPGFTGAH